MATKAKRRVRTTVKPVTRTARIAPPPAKVIPLCLAALVLAGVAAYANSFRGVFVYDDTKWVVALAANRAESPFLSALKARRPLVDLSLAFNSHFAEANAAGEESPWGYHLFNLAVHLLAGFTLFGVVRRTLLLDMFAPRLRRSAHWFAFSVALLWIVHPLQTQGVTYVIQRAESMMGLFYLLTLYAVIRGATANRYSRLWYVAAILACACGMGSKAVMITAPVVVFLYDWKFLGRSAIGALSRRWVIHAALTAATVLVLWKTGVLRGVLFPPPNSGGTVGLVLTRPTHGYHVSKMNYALTQMQVIPHYLKMSFWPRGQAIDYGWPFVEQIREALLPGGFLLLLLAGTAVALWKKPWLGFAGAWFFLILLPTSSIIPIRDAIYEHRMYLSLAGVIVAVVAAIWWVAQFLLDRRSSTAGSVGPICAGVCIIPAAMLGYLTHERNKVYHNSLAMWYNAVAHRPENPRAHNNLGKYLLDVGKKDSKRLDEAVEHLRTAVRLKPNFMNALYNLGNGLQDSGKYDESIRCYRQALDINPGHIESHIMLGNALTDSRRLPEAEKAFRDALRFAPRRTPKILTARAHYNLGNTLFRLTRFEDALQSYRRAVKDHPSHANAWYGIGSSLIRLKRPEQALKPFQTSLQHNPKNAAAWYGVAEAQKGLGSSEKAIAAYRQVIKIDPKPATAWFRIGQIHESAGNREQAVSAYQSALKAYPGHAASRAALQRLGARRG